jgi:tetratricopeptide (TPR) repeat protein
MSCLDENIIAAFVDAGSRLALADITRVERHVRDCAKCRGLLSFALSAVRPAGAHAGADQRGQPDDHDTTLATETVLERGSQFGRYTVLGLVGRGAMSEVYAAYDPGLDRKVALKILHGRGGGADARSSGRLLREAKAIARLRHPNVVVVHEAGTIAERVFLAMEYVDGQTLAAWLSEPARTRKEILEVFVAAGRGLGAAHAAGLVHRDFKPQNVMVGSDGAARVTDFGLARDIGALDSPLVESGPDVSEATTQLDQAELPLTRTGELVGTPLFMAPEQFAGQRTDARTDQFGFCVALYRALYNVHPFAGEKLGELMAAVIAGRVQPAPPKTAVPPWLRRILVRGLSADPALRWESMDALVAALSRDPARQRRRWLGGVAIGAAMLAALVAARWSRTSVSLCHGGPARLAEVWELPQGDNPSGRRAATRAAFLRTGVDSAIDTWDRAARVVDRYTADWLRIYGDTCAATHVRGEQSADVLDLRMACLQDRLDGVRALTDVFADANATVITNAVNAVSALPSLERCADVKLLRAVMPSPDSPAMRTRVEALRKDLARTRALNASGQCGAAGELRRRLIADADAVGYQPLQAESLTASVRAGTACVAHDEVMPNARRGLMLALASHHDEAAAEAAIFLAQWQADRTGDVSRARDWIDLASAIMKRMGKDHAILETWRLQALAVVHDKEGSTREALATIELAQSLMEKAQGREHHDYVTALMNEGVILVNAKRFEEAQGYYQRAAQLAAKVVGPNHPLVAMILANSAEALNSLHRYDQARSAGREALRVWRRSGSSKLYQGFALTTLGESSLGAGRPRDAAVEFEEALGLLRDDPTPIREAARFGLARALWESAETRPRALGLARETEAAYQRLHISGEAANVASWLKGRAGR